MKRGGMLSGVAPFLASIAWMALAGVAPGRPPSASAPLVVRSSPARSDTDGLAELARAYADVDDPCELPGPDELALRHGVRFASAPSPTPAERAKPEEHSPWAALAKLDVTVAFERFSGDGRPWIGLLPEYHEHQESEALVDRISSELVALQSGRRLRVYVEAWSRDLELESGTGSQLLAGIEDPEIYPVSRACWDLMTLLDAARPQRPEDVPAAARAALLDAGRSVRLLVGEHPTRESAEKATSRYGRIWNRMVRHAVGRDFRDVLLPVGAGYRKDGRWSEHRVTARLAIPVDQADYARSGRLYQTARSLAAVTSRIRTAEYAFRVLEALPGHGERIVLVQIGANHVQPFVDLVARAGANVAVFVSPAAQAWLGAAESWRCPTRLGAGPAPNALGYSRLPGTRQERVALVLGELAPRGDEIE